MNRKPFHYLLFLVLFFFVSIPLKKAFWDEFALFKIYGNSGIKNELRLNYTDDNASIDQALNQPFYFLDSGRQSFAFQSADGKYVLKFLNQERFYLPFYLLSLDLPFSLYDWKIQKQKKREERVSAFRQSFKLAYEHLKEETGIISLHFFSQKTFPKVQLCFNGNSSAFVDLHKTCFYVQKKAVPLYEQIESILDHEKSLSVLFSALLDTIDKRCKRGLIDDDLNIAGNMGVIGDKAIIIDPGRIYYDPILIDSNHYKKEVMKSTKFLRLWLKEQHPEKLSLFDEKLQELFFKK